MFNWWSRKRKNRLENNFREIDDIRQNQFNLPKTTTIESLQLRSLQQLGIKIENQSMPNWEDNNKWGEVNIIWNISKWKEQNGLMLVDEKYHLMSNLKLQIAKTKDRNRVLATKEICLCTTEYF